MSAVHRMCIVALIALLAGGWGAYAEEIRVMTNGAFAAAHLELSPRCERATNHTVVTESTTTGVGLESVPNRIMRGDAVDVVILFEGLIRKLIEAGKVVPDSRRTLAAACIGIAVRAGAAKPDISTVEALKRTLLEARSVAYSAGASGMYLSDELFPRLGIAQQMKAKSQRIEGERVGAVVCPWRSRNRFPAD